ncbi:hypothetical protein [Lichenibacterium minor]|nr:hypothetical protein [Lichenibacterium minor]
MTAPTTSAHSGSSAGTRRESLFLRMVRLWIEHHQRVIDLGLAPH